MQNFNLLCSVTLIVVSFGYAAYAAYSESYIAYTKFAKAATNCTPGESVIWFDYCKSCRCAENGVWICTNPCGFKIPEHLLPAADPGPHKRPTDKNNKNSSVKLEDWTPKWKKFFEETASCKVGEQRRDPDDCNWCECTAPGSMVCDTKKKCFQTNRETLSASPSSSNSRLFSKTPEDVERYKKFSEIAASCTVGDRIQDPLSCNMCDCIENGVIVCSRGFCGKKTGMLAPKRLSMKGKNRASKYAHKFHRLHRLKQFAEKAAECTVGDRMKDYNDCNWCECVETGVMLCDRIGCASKSTRAPSLLAHGKDAAVIITASYNKLNNKIYHYLRDKSKDCFPGGKPINTPCHVCKCIHHGAMRCVSVKGRNCDKNKKLKRNPILKLDLPADSDYFAYS